MSPSSLHDALHDVARQQPPVAVDPETYRRGRRAHRRGVALTSLATVAAVGLVTVGGVGLMTGWEPDTAGEGFAGADGVPGALPDHVYAVRPGLGPNHQHGWHPDLAVDSPAVGPLSVVFTADRYVLPGVVGVSAEDGRYVGLDLPGLSTESSGQFGDNPAALSPDGDRLAYSWKDDRRPRRSGVRVLDLETGEVTDHRVPSELGVLTSGISWSPDERYLVYGRRTVTDPPTGVEGARNYRVERLDLTTGERVVIPFQPGQDAAAVDEAGEVAVPGSPAAVWRQRGRDVLDGLGTEAVSVAWAPDGERLALGDYQGGAGVHDRTGTGITGLDEAGPDDTDLSRNVHVLGWLDDDEFAVRIDNVEEIVAVSDDGTSTRPLFTMDTQVVSPSVATDLLGVPTRDDPRPPFVPSWFEERLRSAGALEVVLGAGLLLACGYGVTRLARRRGWLDRL